MISNRSFVLPILELTKQGVQMNGADCFVERIISV